jgi:hypothetical protein
LSSCAIKNVLDSHTFLQDKFTIWEAMGDVISGYGIISRP